MFSSNRSTNLKMRSHPKGCSRITGLTWFVRPSDGTLPSGVVGRPKLLFTVFASNVISHRLCCCQLGIETGTIAEHAMHYDCELTCQRHLGLLHARPDSNLCRPALELRALDWSGEDDVRSFV